MVGTRPTRWPRGARLVARAAEGLGLVEDLHRAGKLPRTPQSTLNETRAVSPGPTVTL